MGIWGLSESLVEAIAFHHCPGKCSNGSFGTLTAVHLANSIDHRERDSESTERLDLAYLEKLGISERLNTNRTIQCDPV